MTVSKLKVTQSVTLALAVVAVRRVGPGARAPEPPHDMSTDTDKEAGSTAGPLLGARTLERLLSEGSSAALGLAALIAFVLTLCDAKASRLAGAAAPAPAGGLS